MLHERARNPNSEEITASGKTWPRRKRTVAFALILTACAAAAACTTSADETTSPSDAPAATATTVAAASPVAATVAARGLLSGSSRTHCAVIEGAVWCWGSGEFGQLGEGSFPVVVGEEELEAIVRHVAEYVEYCRDAAEQPSEECPFGAPTGSSDEELFDSMASTVVAEMNKGWRSPTVGYDAATNVVRIEDPVNGGVCATTVAVPTGDDSTDYGYDVDCRDLSSREPHESSTPVKVRGMESDVSAVTVGLSHVCALRGGGVWCWGSNSYDDSGAVGGGGPALTELNKLGNPAAMSDGLFVGGWGYVLSKSLLSPTPVPAVGLETDVSMVVAGWDHTCALRQGEVFCWGANNLGQTGQPLADTYRDAYPSTYGPPSHEVSIPTKVEGIDDEVTAISIRGSTSCALTVKGAVLCWGENSQLQIAPFKDTIRFKEGEENQIYSHYTPRPVVVPDLSTGVSSLGAGCALRDGRTVCVGWNKHGDFDALWEADRDSALNLAPVSVEIVGVESAAILLQSQWDFDFGSDSVCALVGDAVRCWKQQVEQDDPKTGLRVGSSVSKNLERDVVALGNTCAMVRRGSPGASSGTVHEIWCWGSDYSGKFRAGVGEPLETHDHRVVRAEEPVLVFCYLGSSVRAVLREGDRCLRSPAASPPIVLP